MKKQTKVVAVLSAAALLAMGASMTSFAAGWEKDDEGIWHYYDADGDMVTSDWAKDGSNFYYLDDDGNMLTDAWVDDDYYVGSDGAMLKNQWVKTLADDEDNSDPEDSGEHWYYFGSKGKKVTDDDKKINGKTYYFDADGKMLHGWQEKNGDVYYLGDEDEGWRAESQWLWLEKSSLAADDDSDDDTDDQAVLGCTEDDDCDDEGWYYFQSSGKMYKEAKKKKINGYYFLFNEHGQMLYEWINGTKLSASNAQLDGIATPSSATIGQMLWYKENGNDADEGSRYTGWMQIDGAEDVGTDTDTDWYYFKKGEAKHADASDVNGLRDDGDPVYVMREKIDGKYFAFNEKGQMQTGLQFIEGNTYYFDDNGYQQTGKISNVEEDDDDTYYYYFQTKNNGNGKGYNGVKDNILYFMGKRCEAEDDYRIFQIGSKYYVVNSKGRVQKTDKKYDIETLGGGVVEDVQLAPNKKTGVLTASDLAGKGLSAEEIEVPHIELCDNWIVPDENGAAAIVDAGTDYKTGTLTSAD
ncbi:N-acetylmuramoyl-L-alanine amidase family protein [Clostridium vitabionis]|uniref:N-acetylmuramoyl-L-alanine amidase family protein n=1 Tax=Clostridium vitabionis TaxID=2784388 RepID=UPI001889C4AA|nr:glucan-binding protein [Clostridium vitabionis]